MTMFPVGEAKVSALKAKMAALNIRAQDIEESFIRSGGKGGQNVNKTSTCVYLRHIPTERNIERNIGTLPIFLDKLGCFG